MKQVKNIKKYKKGFIYAIKKIDKDSKIEQDFISLSDVYFTEKNQRFGLYLEKLEKKVKLLENEVLVLRTALTKLVEKLGDD